MLCHIDWPSGSLEVEKFPAQRSGMFTQVVITADVVEGKARPLYTYSDKAETQKTAS